MHSRVRIYQVYTFTVRTNGSWRGAVFVRVGETLRFETSSFMANAVAATPLYAAKGSLARVAHQNYVGRRDFALPSYSDFSVEPERIGRGTPSPCILQQTTEERHQLFRENQGLTQRQTTGTLSRSPKPKIYDRSTRSTHFAIKGRLFLDAPDHPRRNTPTRSGKPGPYTTQSHSFGKTRALHNTAPNTGYPFEVAEAYNLRLTAALL